MAANHNHHRQEEITATFLRESFRSDNGTGDWMSGVVWWAGANDDAAMFGGEPGGELLICGNADPDELQPDQEYRFLGKHGTYKNKRTGKTSPQFAFDSFVLEQPKSRAAVIAYLRAAGDGINANFGAGRAAKCWELYGSDAVKVLREDPTQVAADLTRAGLQLSEEQAAKVAAVLERDKKLEACTLELNGLLLNRGFRKTLAKQLLKDFGNTAAEVIAADPFKLIENKYPGCGFKLVDKMYLSLGHPPGWLKRQAFAAWHAVSKNREGHVWVPRSVAEAGIRGCVSGTELRIEEAMQLAFDLGMLREIRTMGQNGPIAADELGGCCCGENTTLPAQDGARGTFAWVALADMAQREEELAEMIVDAMEEPFEWPDVATIENIDKEQPAELAKALQGSVAIFGGMPGTGKTHTVGNLIKSVQDLHGRYEVGIGAPTNLAAQRLTDAMAKGGVSVRARTWHSLLGKPRIRGHQWNHDAENPFPFKVIVGDEASMNDLRIAHAIFSARAKGTMVLWVGDIRQLMPVDRGAPLRDMIAAGLPYGELTEIRRNSGGIVEACKAIALGKPWGEGDNLKIIEVDEEERQLQAVIATLEECRDAGYDPVWDSRIIVAKNDTRRAFNKVLQGVLNHNPAIEGSPFRVGDKVINRANKDFPVIQADRGDEDCEFNDSGDSVRVFNGELGEVLEVEEKYFVVKVLCPERVVKVLRGKIAEVSEADDNGDDADKTGTGCSWDLAYCITFHSSQGSQFPYAIIVASSRDGMLGSRELVYTGISRAQVKAVLIGWKSTFDKFCRKVALKSRKTLLKEWILLKQAERVLVDL